MQLVRDIQPFIEKHLREHKILLLNGPKTSGRVALIKQVLGEQSKPKVYKLEDKEIRQSLEHFSPEKAENLFASGRPVVFKEGQYLSSLQQWIEWVLFDDRSHNLIVINSFEPHLDDLLMEALRSQGLVLQMAAPVFQELASAEGLIHFETNLDRRLIYGNLVDLNHRSAAIEEELIFRADAITEEPLSRNERINKSDKLKRLLQFLAFYVGEQISFHEIGIKCDLDNETVERYVRLLEKAYVLHVLPAWQSNKRYELKKTQHIYFHDNGIRNAVIRNFNSMELRHDSEMLWKNWLISERLKRSMNKQQTADSGFWATHTRQRVDYVEQGSKGIWASQILWDKKLKGNFPATFNQYYPEATPFRITKANYWTFLNRD